MKKLVAIVFVMGQVDQKMQYPNIYQPVEVIFRANQLAVLKSMSIISMLK